MSENVTYTSSGSGFSALSLLGVVFITLKLLGIAPVAAWSWWWVTLPFWGGFALVVAIWLIFLLIALLVAVFGK